MAREFWTVVSEGGALRDGDLLLTSKPQLSEMGKLAGMKVIRVRVTKVRPRKKSRRRADNGK